jgi:5'-3' exonuclease
LNKRPPKYGDILKISNTLLVDGNALFKVGFFGAKNEYNFRGEHIGGVYQFLTVVRKLLNEEVYDNVFVFWDGLFSGRLRYEIYSPYKSERGKDYINGTQPQDENELRERILVMNYLEEFGIRQLKDEIVESDDFIAYYCLNSNKNEKITICTNDRDLSQLISDNVRIYFCNLKNYVTLENYSTFFSHHQSNVALIKTIVGDNSDSIVGIAGVKEKTLINLFPELKERKVTLNEIVEKAGKLQQERINSRKKPLKALDNIINRITTGVQGKKIYEINHRLVDLKTPMITEEAIEKLNFLRESEIDFTDRDIKNVIIKMKQDGLEHIIGSDRYHEYLLPYKKLILREISKNDKKSTL